MLELFDFGGAPLDEAALAPLDFEVGLDFEGGFLLFFTGGLRTWMLPATLVVYFWAFILVDFLSSAKLRSSSSMCYWSAGF